jgi:hypothetical protein
MSKTRYMFAGLAGAIVIFLIMGAPIKERPEESSKLPSHSATAQIRSTSSERSHRSRRIRPREIAVNYAFLEQGLKLSLPKLYGDFIQDLDLEPIESRYFESLLVERLIAQQKFGLELMAGDENERLISTRTIENRITENNSKIRGFLNHQGDYADFVGYEQRFPERGSLGDIRPLMCNLTSETEERLIDILYQCRVKEEGELPVWETMLADVHVSTKQEYWRRCDDNIALLIPSILPDDQARDFLSLWKIARDYQKEQYEITRSLFHREE